MTTVDINPKKHRKLKKEALKRNMDLKDLVDEKLGGLIIMAILFVGGLGLAYAEEVTVNIPFDNWNTDFCTFMGFPLENGTTLYKYECIWTGWLHQIEGKWVPVEPTDSTIVGLPDAPEAFIIWPPEDRQEIVVEEPEEEETQMDRNIIAIDERREEIQREKEALIGKLSECRTGLGAFAAYQEQEAIQDYTNQTRWQFVERDNLSNSPVLTILKAIEECDIMQDYVRLNLISEFELNKYLADLAGTDYLGRGSEHPLAKKVTDQSDAMVETDPVTPKDLAQEVQEAEELRDRLIAERVFEDPYGDCIATADDPDKCTNRGFQPEGVRCQATGQPHEIGGFSDTVCPLDAYNKHIMDNPTLVYQDYLNLQCKYYLNMYIHKLGTDDFPVWLNHCVPKVVRES